MVSRGGGQFPAHQTTVVPASELPRVAPAASSIAYYRPSDESTIAVCPPADAFTGHRPLNVASAAQYSGWRRCRSSASAASGGALPAVDRERGIVGVVGGVDGDDHVGHRSPIAEVNRRYPAVVGSDQRRRGDQLAAAQHHRRRQAGGLVELVVAAGPQANSATRGGIGSCADIRSAASGGR